eukprot:evm.model.scf_476.2 EVM.evm.TU.scf_476.2   scf_476:13747-23862(-)
MGGGRDGLLCERLQLHEEVVGDEDTAQAGPAPVTTSAFLGITNFWAARGAASGRRGAGKPSAVLRASANGERAAAFDPRAGDVSVLAVTPRGAELISKFDPRGGPQLPHRARDPVALLAWSPDGSRLAVATLSGCLHVLDGAGNPIKSWGAGEAWARGSLVGVEILPDGSPVLLSGTGRFHTLPPDLGPPSSVQSVSAYHAAPRCMALDAARGVLAVAGDGPNDPGRKPRDAGEATAEEGRITVSLWRRTDAWEPIMSVGNRPGGDLFGRIAGRAGRPSVEGWAVSASPSGEHVAVRVPGRGVKILSVTDRRFMSHAGDGSGSGAECLLEDAALVGWWTPGVLAVRTVGAEVRFIDGEDLGEVWPSGSCGFARGSVAARGGGDRACVLVMQPMLLTADRHARRPAGRDEGEERRESAMTASESHEWPDSLNRGWTLHSLVERTPDEMLEIYLKRHAWTEAHALAGKHGLDTNLIFKFRWSATPVDENNINENLKPVTDRRWVIEQCLARVADVSKVQKELLEYGTLETERWYHRARSVPVDGSSALPEGGIADRDWLLLRRMDLLGSLDRLETFCRVQEGEYSAQAYDLFRVCDLAFAARAFAALGDLTGLQILLQRHTRALFPKMLDILSHIPEATDPRLYTHLLPLPGTMAVDMFIPARDADWAETQATAQLLMASIKETTASSTVMDTEHILAFSDLDTLALDEKSLEKWYTKRAKDIDSATGQLGFAKALLEMGVEKGLGQDVAELLKSVQFLSGTVKGSQAGWFVGLEEFSAMSRAGQLKLLLEGSTIDRVEGDLEERILPFFAGLDSELRAELLSDLFATQMGARLEWCERLAELEAAEVRLFGSGLPGALAFANSVTTGILVWPQSAQWDQLNVLLRHAHSCLEAHEHELEGCTSPGCNKAWSQAVSEIEVLNGCISVGKRLSGLGVVMAIDKIKSMDQEGGLRAVRTILARASRAGRSWPDAKWEGLARDLQAIGRRLPMPLESETVTAELCRALLRAGKFAQAQRQLAGDVDSALEKNNAEMLVLSAGREFLYSASSLDVPAVSDARECFQLLPDSQAARLELKVIEALQMLPARFGLNVLPMQMKQSSRSQVLQHAVTTRAENYKDREGLKILAGLLDVTDPNELSELDIMVGWAALHAGDLAAAQEIAVSLMKTGFENAWEFCGAVGQFAHRTDVEQGVNVETCMKLLAFATVYCPDDRKMGFVKALEASGECLPTDAGDLDLPTEELLLMAVSGDGSDAGVNASLPSLWDVPLALTSLFALEPNTEPFIQSILETCASERAQRKEMKYASFVQLMHSYVVFNLLKVLTDCNTLNSTADRVGKMQELLGMSVLQLLEAARAAGGLNREGQDALSRAEAGWSTIEAARDARNAKRIMSDVDMLAFACGKGRTRNEVVLRLGACAGMRCALQDLGSGGESKDDVLELARNLAAKYGTDAWDLSVAFLESALLAATEITPGIGAMAVCELEKLLDRPQDTLCALVFRVWSGLPGAAEGKLTYVLSLMAECLNVLDQQGTHGAADAQLQVKTVAELIGGTGYELAGLDCHAFVSWHLNRIVGPFIASSDGASPVDRDEEDEQLSVAALQAAFDCVGEGNAAPLAALADGLHQALGCETGTLNCEWPSAWHLQHSSSYLVLICKMTSLWKAEGTRPSLISDLQKSLESESFWASCFGQMSSEDILASLMFMALWEPVPLLKGVSGLYVGAPGLPLAICLPALKFGLAKIKDGSLMLSEESLRKVDTLTFELSKCTALYSAPELEGVSRAELSALLDSDDLLHDMDEILQRLLAQRHKMDDLLRWTFSIIRGTNRCVDAVQNDCLSDWVTKKVAGIVEQMMDDCKSRLPTYLRHRGQHGDDSAEDPSDAVSAVVDSLDILLEGSDVGENEQIEMDVDSAVCSIREDVWQRLTALIAGLDEDLLSGGDTPKLLEIQASIAGGACWPGWKSIDDPSQTTKSMAKLMYVQSQATLSGVNGVSLTLQDLESCDTAAAAFGNILAACPMGSLGALAQLLTVIWQHGLPWEPLQAMPDNVALLPMHGSWHALLNRMADCGHVGEVLNVLDSVQASDVGELAAIAAAKDQQMPSSTWQGHKISALSHPEAAALLDLLEARASLPDFLSACLLSPFDDLKGRAFDRLNNIGSQAFACSDALLALLLDGRWILDFVEQPIFNGLCQPLKNAAPHPSLLAAWPRLCDLDAQGSDERKGEPKVGASGIHQGSPVCLETELDDSLEASQSSRQHRDLSSSGAGPAAASQLDKEPAVVGSPQEGWAPLEEDAGDGWGVDAEWEETVRASTSPLAGVVQGRDAQPDPLREQRPDVESGRELEVEDGAGGEGWGVSGDWEETVRDAAKAGKPEACGAQKAAVQSSKMEMEDLVDGEGWDASGNWEETVRDAEKAVDDSSVSCPPTPGCSDRIPKGEIDVYAMEPQVALEDLDAEACDGWGDGDWEETVKAAEQEGAESMTVLPGPVAARLEVGSQQDEQDPGGGIEDEQGGWGHSDDWEVTVRAAEEAAARSSAGEVVANGPEGLPAGEEAWRERRTLVVVEERGDGECRAGTVPLANSRLGLGVEDDPGHLAQPVATNSDRQSIPGPASPIPQQEVPRCVMNSHGSGDSLLTSATLLPMLVGILCSAGKHSVAAALLAEKLRLHRSLASLCGGFAVLERYLRAVAILHVDTGELGDWQANLILPKTSERLLQGVQEQCAKALERLLADVNIK